VWDIGRSVDGRIFACTDSGVAVLKGETWTTLPGTEGRTLLAGGGNGRDSLWFGGSGKDEPFNVVFRLDLKTGRLAKVSIAPCKTTDLVLSMASAPDGGAYVGTRFEGVFRVHPDKQGWKTESLPFPDRPSGDRVNTLLKDREGHLVAAAEHGLYVLDQGHWTALGTKDGLLGTNCGSLARDPSGSIWVAYQDARGISRLGQDHGVWKAVASLTQPEALFNAAIASMVFEPTGALWLGTGAGMKHWDGKVLESFGRGDGLGSQDPSANGITRDWSGGIWLGSSNGVSYFQPRAYRGPAAPPAARILEIRDAHGERDPLASRTEVPYRDHTLTFHFSALSFLNEPQIVHEVRLVGLENEWRETRLNEARYAALPAGTYRFEVRSRRSDGPPGPAASFGFRILPPWWDTWWFRMLTLLGAASAILAFLRHRTAQLSRRNAQLEAMVAHRTEALEASKLELEKVNKALEEATLVDPLTGLHNRRYLDLSLPKDALQAQRAFRERLDAGTDPLEPKEDILLFLMDIDHFKTVNDTHGHLAGDLVLKQLATILRGCTRASDSLVRWGGEEFLLVARRTRRSDAPGIAHGLLEAIRHHTFQLPEGVAFHKSWSLGFCALPIHPHCPEIGDWQQALKVADQCLYAAKESGRDRWVGALMPPDTDPAPLAGLKTWDVGWALKRGLMIAASSDPGFHWPE
jgi:diguanylate cyclase (GGDEF)-like protein